MNCISIKQKKTLSQTAVLYTNVLLLVLAAYGGFYEDAWANRPGVMHLQVERNKAETGGLDLKTSFPCQSVKEEKCQSGLRIQVFHRCRFKASFSGCALGAACSAIGSSVAHHCRQCLLSVKRIPTGRPVFKAPR